MNAALLHAEPPPLLRVSRLSASFGPGRALTDVNLTIGTGELVAVAGEPGSGKTTLARCIAGDIAPAAGDIRLLGQPVPIGPGGAARQGIALVWQDLALCDNLDVAGNVLLGQESTRMRFSESRLHAAAASLLADLRIPIRDTTRLVGSLSGGQRQLVAVAKALVRNPRLLVLDEPTAALGIVEAGQVEELITSLRAQGTTILLAGRDIEQMFRLADRIVVLRKGSVVAELDPHSTHPDDLAALLSGQEVDSSARRQLTRLHGLADRLVSADPSSSLPLILSALGGALGTERVCIHVVSGRSLHCTASLGFAPGQIAPWSALPFGDAGGPVGRAAAAEERVVEESLQTGAWAQVGEMADFAGLCSSCSVPVMGPDGVNAVITVFRPDPGPPPRDELDLLTLYAGYAASAVERDRLLDQVTARNRVLETIREMLETLAGPVTIGEGLPIALQSLRRGLQADEVALVTRRDDAQTSWRAYSGPLGTEPATMSRALREASQHALADTRRDGSAREFDSRPRRPQVLAVPFMAPVGPAALLATWNEPPVTEQETALIEDASHSLRLALEREEAGLAHQEAAALRRSRELQRGFLSRLSHELRTPLTAIRGYASSLMQSDVTWDGDSQQRFLERIAAESARVGRLVDDLLDFSAIESGVISLQRDWCDIRLVIEAAVSCLTNEQSTAVAVTCDAALPVVWADHDRLEQIFVNLLNNAFQHNPSGTHVHVLARDLAGPGAPPPGAAHDQAPRAEVEISVIDDGPGFPPQLSAAPFESARRQRSRRAGAGLGLSISRGIVEAHGGRIELAQVPVGTAFRIRLPVEAAGTAGAGGDAQDPAYTDEPAVVLDAGGRVAVAPTMHSDAGDVVAVAPTMHSDGDA